MQGYHHPASTSIARCHPENKSCTISDDETTNVILFRYLLEEKAVEQLRGFVNPSEITADVLT